MTLFGAKPLFKPTLSNSAVLLSIRQWRTHPMDFSEEFQKFSFQKMHYKMLSAKWRPLCFRFNVLTYISMSNIRWFKSLFLKVVISSSVKLKSNNWKKTSHYDDVIMTTMASLITSLAVVYSIVYSRADQRKHQSSASLAFVRGIHREWWIPRTKGQ